MSSFSISLIGDYLTDCCSLGRAWAHDLISKLDQAARVGLDIELFFEDLEYFSHSIPGDSPAERQLLAAKRIRSLCNERSVSIVCLQPFMHYEGLRDRELHCERVDEFKHWIRLAKILDTRIISVPSTTLSREEASGDIDLIVGDLREIADLAASSGVNVAYEALAWGTHVDTWEAAWNVVQKVDRPNFGICLDTFNMAARVYADPTAPSRKTHNAEQAMRKSLQRLVEQVDVDKVLYVQVVDGALLAEPLIEGHAYYRQEQPPRMSWSRNCRLFYGEEPLGGYLPVRAILDAILTGLGFKGWVSAELFNVSLTEHSAAVPQEHADRAWQSFDRIRNDLTAASHVQSPCREIADQVARAQL